MDTATPQSLLATALTSVVVFHSFHSQVFSNVNSLPFCPIHRS